MEAWGFRLSCNGLLSFGGDELQLIMLWLHVLGAYILWGWQFASFARLLALARRQHAFPTWQAAFCRRERAKWARQMGK